MEKILKLNYVAVKDSAKGTRYITVYDEKGNVVESTTLLLQ